MGNWFDQKRGWRKITPSSSCFGLINIFSEVIEEAKDIGVWDDNIDEVSFYLVNTTHAIASCNYHIYSFGEKDIGFTFNERIATNFPEDKLREIVIHEVAHACTTGHHHDAVWERTCRQIGRKWGYTGRFYRLEQNAAINACMREQKREKAKYMVKCPACGASWLYQKVSRCVNHPESFRCVCGWKGLQTTIL